MIRKIFAFVVVVIALCGCEQTPVDNYIPLTSVSLNQTEEEMLVGETLQLKVLLTPSNATEKDVMWGTNKRTVATVSETGLVTAVGEGTAVITVTASGDKKASCTITVLKPRIEVQSVTLDKEDITIEKGQTAVLKATVSPADATDATVTWSTSDETIANVDQNGKVTAMGGGSATITAAAGGKSADCSVTVTVPVESISLDRNEVALVEGESASLTATVLPDDATDKSVEWTSSNAEIATIDSEGTVTAIKEGTATITAKAGDKTATCVIIVEKKIIHVESITISRSELDLKVGTTETLSVTILPEDATYQSCTWTSTNPEIAEVDQTGKVTAKTVGTVTVTATTTDGGLIAACEVTVYVPYVPVENITLSNTTLNLNKGQTATLTAIISPTNATVQTVSWSSNNMDVAQIDRYGMVTAVGGGQATILAEAGNISAECVVTVTVPVESIELDKTELTLEEGEIATLQALVSPDDATEKAITWTSSNQNVATVDAAGKVTAIGEGMATISAKSGSITAVCTVAVTKKIIHVTTVQLSEIEGLSLNLGETFSVSAIITPNDATDQDITWTSDNTEVATVDANGVITAVKGGVANITATVDGITSDALVVVVIEPKPLFLRYPYCLLRTGNGITQEVWYGTCWADHDSDNLPVLTWTSSNEAVAVPESGNTFRAIGPGSAILTGVDASGSSISFVMNVEDPAEVPYDDYLPGIPLVNCHDASAKWACTNGEYALTDGYVDGVPCMGATVDGYKIAEVYFDRRKNVTSIHNPALFIRFYIDDISKFITMNVGDDPIIEIRSTDALGTYQDVTTRAYWRLCDIFSNMDNAKPTAHQELKSGWNNVVLPLSEAFYNGFNQYYNLSNLTYFRFYQMYKRGSETVPDFKPTLFKFDQIRIIDWTEFDNCDNFKMWRDRPAHQNQYSYKDDTDGKAEGRSCIACEDVLMTGNSTYRLEMWPGLEYAMPAVYEPQDLALAFKFWIDEPDFLVNHFQFNVELASEFTPDYNGFDFAYGVCGDPWPVQLKAGWNDLKFNFEDVMGSLKGENWDPRKITYFRLILTNVDESKETIKHHTFKIDDIRIVRK